MSFIKPSTIALTTLAAAALCSHLLLADSNNSSGLPEADIATIAAAVPEQPLAQPKTNRTILVFSVARGFKHASIPWGQEAFRLLGEKTGAYTAVVSDDLSHFEPENIVKFDAILFNNTTQEVFLPHPDQLQQMQPDEKKAALELDAHLKASLLNFIRSGKGFIGIHAATDTFYKWPEYGEMIGGYFDGHPWNAGTDVSIAIDNPDHILNKPLKGTSHLDFKEEIYQFREPYQAGRQHILLRLDTERSPMDIGGIKRTDNDFPVAWIRNEGKGRVFYSSLGHNTHIYTNPKVLAHYLAGIQWALGDLEAEPSDQINKD